MRGVRRKWVIVGALCVVALPALAALIAQGATGSSATPSIALDGEPGAVAVDGRAGRVFVLSQHAPNAHYRDSVSVVDAQSGALVQRTAVGLDPRAVVVDEGRNRVFVANSRDGTVSVLDVRTGSVRHTVSLSVGGDLGAMALDERTGRVFVTAWADASAGIMTSTVSTLDASSGRVVQTVDGGFQPGDLAVDERSNRIFVLNGGAPRNGFIGGVRVLDARSGAVLQKVTVCAAPLADRWGLAVDAGRGHVFVGCGKRISMLDTRSGKVLSTTSLGTSADSAMVADGRTGRLFVGTGADISILDTTSMHRLRTVPVGYAMEYVRSLAVDDRRNRVLVMSDDAYHVVLHVLDARTGADLRTIPLGASAYVLAVDEQSGRVFVVYGEGSADVPDRWAWVPTWLRHLLPFLPPPVSSTRSVPPGVRMLDVTP